MNKYMTYNIIPHNARQTWQSLEHPSSKPESSGSVFLINRINCFLLSEMSSMSSSKRFFEKTSTSEEHETNSSTRDLQTLFSPSSLARFSLEGEKIVASKNKSFGTGVQSSKHKIYKDLQTGAKNCADSIWRPVSQPFFWPLKNPTLPATSQLLVGCKWEPI